MLRNEWEIVKRMTREMDYPPIQQLDYLESMLHEYGHIYEIDADDPVQLEYQFYCDQCTSEDLEPLGFVRWLVESKRSSYVKYD